MALGTQGHRGRAEGTTISRNINDVGLPNERAHYSNLTLYYTVNRRALFTMASLRTDTEATLETWCRE